MTAKNNPKDNDNDKDLISEPMSQRASLSVQETDDDMQRAAGNLTSRLSIVGEVTIKIVEVGLSFTITLGIAGMVFIFRELDVLEASSFLLTFYNFCVSAGCSFAFTSSFLAPGLRAQIDSKKPTSPSRTLDSSSRDIPQVDLDALALCHEVASLLKQSMALCAPLTLAATGAMLGAKDILEVFDVNSQTAQTVQDFTRPATLIMFPAMMRLCDEQLLLCYGKQFLAMGIALLDFALGIAAACYLSFGPPAMGVAGIAWGLVIDNLLTCIGYCMLLLHKDFKDYDFFKLFKKWNFKDWDKIKMMAKIGAPIAITMLSDLICLLLLSIINADESAVQGVFAQFFTLPSVFIIAGALATLQKFLGEKNPHNQQRIAIWGLVSSLLVVSPFCLWGLINPDSFANFISKSLTQEQINKARPVIRLAALGVGLEDTALNQLHIIRGKGENVVSTATSLAGVWLGLGGAFLAKQKNLGIVARIAIFCGGLLLRTGVFTYSWLKKIQPPGGNYTAPPSDPESAVVSSIMSDVPPLPHPSAMSPSPSPTSSSNFWSNWKMPHLRLPNLSLPSNCCTTSSELTSSLLP